MLGSFIILHTALKKKIIKKNTQALQQRSYRFKRDNTYPNFPPSFGVEFCVLGNSWNDVQPC